MEVEQKVIETIFVSFERESKNQGNNLRITNLDKEHTNAPQNSKLKSQHKKFIFESL